MERTMTQRLVAEFVGTFTFVFIGAGAVIAAPRAGAAAGLVTVGLASGLAIATMVSALGHVSGAHFNPAVTIGAWVTQKIDFKSAFGYLLAQLAGGAAGAGVLRAALPEVVWKPAELGTPLVSTTLISNGQGVLIEAILTFFVVWVIFATAVDPGGSFPKVAGLAIGFAFVMGIFMGGPFTGGVMNPARSFGPALVGGNWAGWWVYWIGPIAGGIVAASLYDSLILTPRVGGGSAADEEQPHGVGAHGEEPPLTPETEM